VTSEFGLIMQLGYIVPDVRAAAQQWIKQVGAGPFYIHDSVKQDQYRYRGVLTDLDLQLGFGYWGSMQIELIKPLSTTDTLYTRALRDTPGQLNHCASYVNDLDALLTRHQLTSRVVHSGQTPTGLKYVYLEEYLPGGHHLELVQAPESTRMVFAGMEKVSRSWDGSNPLRPMSAIGADLAALAAV
jgi:methylmalonyl-CoA/ethylmalonyl-CoA epimerase